ncbi:RNA polymerase sigma factor WhiG [Carboxydochorda subterranea]|uniref:RNA polymerase sigma factor n=1 Tax=Carboxydichorda subterranea TaxID=3109565 RepID=A0ABZ1C0B4_9FIRM|nr:RNA polymerase sigma factor WhiG [Limnochorda sp. L945t]WRP18467.1 RNA polymerase sigma factor WhiG [Limnochorda sp. L945t]
MATEPEVASLPVSSRLAAVWKEFKEHRSPHLREQLILEYAPLVKHVAGRLAVVLPPYVEFDDLVSYGIFGLVEAVERYDFERGVKFETYAAARIRGAIIDGLRAADWVPRSVRHKARELEKKLAQLESQLGRAASDEEIANALGISMQEYDRLMSELAGAQLVSLDEVWVADPEEESQLKLMETVSDAASPSPAEEAEERDLERMLAQAIDRLPERERLVIALYYKEGLTLKEIGRVLGVTESRVCQIHTKAIVRLRSHLQQAS